MLNVQHVSGGYSNESVLKDISFEVQTGELFGIVGPNGSGKTTLLKMISGILPITKGDIYIKGKKASGIHYKTAGTNRCGSISAFFAIFLLYSKRNGFSWSICTPKGLVSNMGRYR